MTPGTVVICGLPGPWLAELQRRFARQLGSGAVEPVIPQHNDKHYGLLQETLGRIEREKRAISRVMVCRGFGLNAYLFQKVNKRILGKAIVGEYEEIISLLSDQFPRKPNDPVDFERMVRLTGQRLLVVHEPLLLDHPDEALSQLGIEPGQLETNFIEIDESLRKEELERRVQSFAPTSCVISSHRQVNWRPSDILLGQDTPLPAGCRTWHGRTLFHGLHKLMCDYEANKSSIDAATRAE